MWYVDGSINHEYDHNRDIEVVRTHTHTHVYTCAWLFMYECNYNDSKYRLEYLLLFFLP